MGSSYSCIKDEFRILSEVKKLLVYVDGYVCENFPKNKKLTHAFSVFEPFLPESSEVIDMMVKYFRKF